MESQFSQEQKRVDRIMKIIEDEKDRLAAETAQRQSEVIHIRKNFSDEVKVNVDTFDDFLETIIGLRQEAQALSVSQSIHKHASKRLHTLQKMLKNPYFGRIDFTEEGTSSPEQVYIGISSLTDASGDEFLIYDWRAPISSVYYDYQPGPAEYTTPGGVIEGTLEKKWQYLIRKGVLQSMFDTSITIGDEILQQVLGKGSDKQMHSIVATIQQEQNRIIRHDKGNVLIVHGAAGSGKTSAALQRIAYLLYKYRDKINADQIMLFSPNKMFNHYVSNVLPELGEENMLQVTFQEYLDHRLADEYQVEHAYDQLEYVLTAEQTPTYQARIEGIQFKASINFFNTIEAYRKSLEDSGMVFKDIVFRGKSIITAGQIAHRFYNHDTSLRFHNRLESLQDWLLKRLNGIAKNEQSKLWVEEEIELLSDEEYHSMHTHLAKKQGYEREAIADYDMDPKGLARLIVRRKMKPLRKHIHDYRFVDIKGIYKQLFVDHEQINNWIEGKTPENWTNICRDTLKTLDGNTIYFEDATPFLYLKEMIQGFQSNQSIQHIVIDEGQDYSPFQFEFLKRLFPRAKMTVLGDFNQAIFTHANETAGFDELSKLFGADKTELISLERSYRSTKPIIELTRRLIPGGESIIPFERDGEKPVLTQVASHDELHDRIASKVEELRNQDFNSIAIICQSAEESRRAYKALSGINDIKLVKTSTNEFEQGVIVIPSYLAKGIEFDAVIIYDASDDVYGDESLRRIFYTACTRAMHVLQLYSVSEPSTLLKDVIKEGFIETL